MRKSSLELASGTTNNPQQQIDQSITEKEYERIENELKQKEKIREKLLSEVHTQKGRNIISELYRPTAVVGDGGTADKLIDEAINKIPKENSHYKKASDKIREINKTLKNNNAAGDEGVLKAELEKLKKAIDFWEEINGR